MHIQAFVLVVVKMRDREGDGVIQSFLDPVISIGLYVDRPRDDL